MCCRKIMHDFLKGISIKGFYTLSEGHVTLFICASINPMVFWRPEHMEAVPCAFVILKFVILVFIGAHGGRSMCFCNFELCNFGIYPGYCCGYLGVGLCGCLCVSLCSRPRRNKFFTTSPFLTLHKFYIWQPTKINSPH